MIKSLANNITNLNWAARSKAFPTMLVGFNRDPCPYNNVWHAHITRVVLSPCLPWKAVIVKLRSKQKRTNKSLNMTLNPCPYYHSTKTFLPALQVFRTSPEAPGLEVSDGVNHSMSHRILVGWQAIRENLSVESHWIISPNLGVNMNMK